MVRRTLDFFPTYDVPRTMYDPTMNITKQAYVLILGLGQYPQGSGVSAALYAAKLGAHVVATDLKTAKELAGNVAQLKKYKNVSFALGGHREKDIREADVIVANPRIRPDQKEMKLARKLGKPVVSDISLFLDRCPARVVGITGTRGKSTTSALIAEMLKASKKRVWLGGNILVSPLNFLSKVKSRDIVVLELSSWQCESLGVTKHPPCISVVTNLMRDHLNAYTGMEDYAEAKAQIFRHQGPSDIVVLNADDACGKQWSKEAPGCVYLFGSKKTNRACVVDGWLVLDGVRIIETNRMKLIGEHNIKNALAAMLAAHAAGATKAGIKKALASFKGLENRLETIRTVKGVTYVNDTTATTPDGAIAAERALRERYGFLFFIMGGADKELDYQELAEVFSKDKKRIGLFVMPGSASDKLIRVCKKHGLAYECVADINVAVKRASEIAEKGDAIILSPAAASFGQFKNEFERGEKFKKAVGRIRG